MTEQSIEYFKGGNVVCRNLDGTVNDANNFAVENNENKRVSKGCIARLIVNVKTDLVKQIREKGMNNHGVNVTICWSDIAAGSKFKKGKKGIEYYVIRSVPTSTKQLIKKQKMTKTTEYLSPVRVSRGTVSTTPSSPSIDYHETACTVSIMKAAFAIVCQESENPRTAISIRNLSPPPLMLVKEGVNHYEMGAPLLNARGKEALSCVIIRKGDLCIAPPLSTVCQVRAATSTISTLATNIMKTTPQLSVAVSKESESPMTPLPIMKAPPSLKAVSKRKPSPIIKCSAYSMGGLKILQLEDNLSYCGCNKKG